MPQCEYKLRILCKAVELSTDRCGITNELCMGNNTLFLLSRKQGWRCVEITSLWTGSQVGCRDKTRARSSPAHRFFFSPLTSLGCLFTGYESTCLPPMWPGFDSRTRRHMRVNFVVCSRLCSEKFFFGYSGFPPPPPPPPPQKPTFPISNSIWRVSPYCKAHLIISSV